MDWKIRFVQLTPPGSACSIAFGHGIADTPPGSAQGMQLVVSDIHAARAELVERGVEVSDVQTFDWGSFVFFSDPDGNRLVRASSRLTLERELAAPLALSGRARGRLSVVRRLLGCVAGGRA